MRWSLGALILKSAPGSGRVCCRCYDAFTGLWREIRSGRRRQVDVGGLLSSSRYRSILMLSARWSQTTSQVKSLFCLGNNTIIRKIISAFRLEISVAFLRDTTKMEDAITGISSNG